MTSRRLQLSGEENDLGPQSWQALLDNIGGIVRQGSAWGYAEVTGSDVPVANSYWKFASNKAAKFLSA
jgi:hypothetical protein